VSGCLHCRIKAVIVEWIDENEEAPDRCDGVPIIEALAINLAELAHAVPIATRGAVFAEFSRQLAGAIEACEISNRGARH
jgi:hypothetical protein